MAKGMKHGAGGGASLNFKVVGNPQPERAKENTIWVNTDVEITGWNFTTTEPATPTQGMVWFSTGVSSSAKFNALKKNNLTVYPTFAKQYVDGAWVSKEAKIYKNNAWEIWTTYLYNTGDECTALTGGWKTRAWRHSTSTGMSAIGEPTITKNADSMEVKFSASGAGVAEVAKDINFSGYKTLCCNVTNLVGANDPYATAELVIVPRNATYYSGNSVALSMIKTTGIIALNIEMLDAGTSYDVAIGGQAKSGKTYSVTVDKIWCE